MLVFKTHVINGSDWRNAEYQLGCVGVCVGCGCVKSKSCNVELKFTQVLLVNH